MSDRRNTAAERADEYVLGLLSATEMNAFEAEMEADQMLRVAVARSRDRFLELDLAGSEEPIASDLWSRIEASLVVHDARATAPPQITATTGANDNRASRWRWTALSAITASAVLAIALGYAILDRPRPQVIAVLMDGTGAPLVVVEDFGDTHPRIIPLGDFEAPTDKSMQVWTLPSKEMGATSLGLLNAWQTTKLDSRALPRPHEEQLYEITLEQPGGSPTGRPTGPILVKGFAKVPR
jgi:anti-sigma-K factor RskA